MKKSLIILMSAVFLWPAMGAFAQQSDSAGCKDHPLFPTRMPEYRLSACKVEDFGVYEFWTTKGPKTKIPIEGRFTFITYAFTGQRAAEPSALAIVRNYENAIKKVGGTILGSVPNWWVNGKIVKDGQETWAQIERGNGTIWLRIVEKKAMEQYIVADATALGNDIRSTGHAAVYGILFDTGKSSIKLESAQAIGEIAKMLKADASLKIHVVGHTDNAGDVGANIKLSQERGEAVLQALVRDHAIAAARLSAYGCGQFAPVASNDTEEGRAKNRRVELVKQ
jgi:outer membrane protein OmpA-like peptidoglycan-associated protein